MISKRKLNKKNHRLVSAFMSLPTLFLIGVAIYFSQQVSLSIISIPKTNNGFVIIVFGVTKYEPLYYKFHANYINIEKRGYYLTSSSIKRFDHTLFTVSDDITGSKPLAPPSDSSFKHCIKEDGRVYNRDSTKTYDYAILYILPKYLKSRDETQNYIDNKKGTKDSLLTKISQKYL